MSRIAVFDIGTVTCRLGVFDVSDHHVQRIVYKDLDITNLGSNVDASGMLDESAINRTISCLQRFIDKARATNSDTCICTLTSAARDASNSNDLISCLESLGLKPEIIEGSLEARLSFLGVAQDFPNQRIAVMDSGGGSTELCIGELTDAQTLEIEWLHSYNIGARRLTERYLGVEVADKDKMLQKALCAVSEEYATHKPPVNLEHMKLIGVGGTATTLSAINQGLNVYDPKLVHLSKLSIETIDGLAHKLNDLSIEQRTKIPGLQPKRAEVIVGGICAVEGLMRANGFNELIISENDILCGLAIIADSSFKYEENVVEWKPQLFNL